MTTDTAKQAWISFQGRVPALMLFGLVGQVAAAIWQFGQISAEMRAHEVRLAAVEQRQAALTQHVADRGDKLGEILARVAAQGELNSAILTRLEARFNGLEQRGR